MKLRIKNLVRDYVVFARFRTRVLSALSLGFYRGPGRFRALDGIDLELGLDDHDEDLYDDRGDEPYADPGEKPAKTRSDSGIRRASSGQIVGLVGPNGAGKSTLLQVLSGILGPGAGQVEFSGSVRSILELSVGFHPELTARENLFYNGILWGYDPRELREGMDEILAFAELEEFGNHPIKGLSTGMQMRLGFALATFRRADLLLVDEALSVGDARFQQKSLQRFLQFKEEGSLILVVSHDVNMLLSVCDSMVVMNHGRVEFHGPPAEASEVYRKLIQRSSFAGGSLEQESQGIHYSLALQDENRIEQHRFVSGQRVYARVQCSFPAPLSDLTFGIHIADTRGQRVFGVNSRQLRASVPPAKSVCLDYELQLNLGPGSYTMGLSIHRGLSHATDGFVWEEHLVSFEVEHPAGVPFEGVGFCSPVLHLVSGS